MPLLLPKKISAKERELYEKILAIEDGASVEEEPKEKDKKKRGFFK
mgnify:FL=1